MKRALELARLARGMTTPNPMVGAVIVRDGKIIGEGYHAAAGQPHAEIQAIKNATSDVAGATMYVTMEPCCHWGRTPPCVDALIKHKIARVYAAMQDPNERVAGKGIKQLRAAGIKVEIGLCEEESRRLNEAFVSFHAWHRPFVICKWAMTLDGKIATQTGDSRWITNDESRAYVHEIRSCVDSVMVGIGTVLMDNPNLNVRIEGFHGRQPRPIIIDGSLRIPIRAKCLENSDPGRCIIATTEAAPPERVARLRDGGHHVVVLHGRRGILDMRELISELRILDIQSVFCEGGSGLNGALFQAHLVDKVIAFIAPKLVGGSNAKTAVSGWSVPFMNKAVTLENVSFRTFGTDVCMEGYVSEEFRRTKPLRERVSVGELDSDEELLSE